MTPVTPAGAGSTRHRGRRALRSPVDSTGPHRRILVGELHQLGIARAAIAATVISPRTPPVALSMTAAEWLWTWVSTPMTTSTTSRRSVRLVMRSLLRRTGRGSGTGRRLGRTLMGHPAPLTPGGQAPHQASSFNRARASNRERTCRESDDQRGDPIRRESSSTRAPTQHGHLADRVLAHVGCRARSCRDCNVRPGAPFREGRVGLPLRGCAQPGGTSGPTEGQRPSGTDADSLSDCLSAVASVQ